MKLRIEVGKQLSFNGSPSEPSYTLWRFGHPKYTDGPVATFGNFLDARRAMTEQFRARKSNKLTMKAGA